MKHVVISGYNSFIGNSFYKKYKNKFKITKYKKNINNSSELKKFLIKNNTTHFINFAGLSREKCSKNHKDCFKTNYKSTESIINIFNKLKKKPVFIFISTSHVYNNAKNKLKETSKTNPKSLYAKLKLESENYIKKNYTKYSIIRLFNVYGSNQPKNHFIPDITEKIKLRKIIKIDNSIRDFIHVSEAVNAINFIINKKIYKIVNVGSSKGVSLKNIIKKISTKLKIEPIIQIKNTKTKLVADISLLKSLGYKSQSYEKYLNF